MIRLSNKRQKSKNDIAWEKLFKKYHILENISKIGFFEIGSVSINEFRESRLMAKFDHHANLPEIFKTNKLSILSISRNKYIIGKFDSYLNVIYDETLEAITVEFPKGIESIDYTNLYSESSALSCAFNTGMINNLIDGEETYHTVYGRMSTGTFNFNVNQILDYTQHNIAVNNAQCEIDAGFESEQYFLLLEAKLYDVDDFLVRQLYYPYRLWSSKISNKKVIPILMTYSNSSNIFSFFIYKFDEILNYNSIRLVEQRNYVIAPETITHEDVSEIFKSIIIVTEPNIPFPQANKFERIIDLLTLLLDKELTKEGITANSQFDERQTSYYTDAARYLGLMDKYVDQNTKEITFRLSEQGSHLLKKRYKIKILSLIEKILQHQVFYKTFEFTVSNGFIPDISVIRQIMQSCNLNINITTIQRRSSTVRGWIGWIVNMLSEE
ncbi:translation elongation factor [Nostoc sp. GT001]|uniref:type II restriction enzyme n=1 Tax=Nostoc sp. GT001 TaxID=3056647 RepID=UPI0025AB27AE|nr:translation elongation factor [Nostoc sp. GT001]MDM9583545.1 translation elongation factor [Nostoc sp. GT001]